MFKVADPAIYGSCPSCSNEHLLIHSFLHHYGNLIILICPSSHVIQLHETCDKYDTLVTLSESRQSAESIIKELILKHQTELFDKLSIVPIIIPPISFSSNSIAQSSNEIKAIREKVIDEAKIQAVPFNKLAKKLMSLASSSSSSPTTTTIPKHQNKLKLTIDHIFSVFNMYSAVCGRYLMIKRWNFNLYKHCSSIINKLLHMMHNASDTIDCDITKSISNSHIFDDIPLSKIYPFTKESQINKLKRPFLNYPIEMEYSKANLILYAPDSKINNELCRCYTLSIQLPNYGMNINIYLYDSLSSSSSSSSIVEHRTIEKLTLNIEVTFNNMKYYDLASFVVSCDQ